MILTVPDCRGPLILCAQLIISQMATTFRKIRVVFKGSPSLANNYRPKDELIQISLADTVHHTRNQLASFLGCSEEHLWLYHGDCVFSANIDQRLRWFHVPSLPLAPTVFYHVRDTLPRFIGQMCLVELENLRNKHWKDILSIGWNENPSKLTSPECEYLRVSGAVVFLQEHEESVVASLQKAVFRYLVCTRSVKCPSTKLVLQVTQQVKTDVLLKSPHKVNSKRISRKKITNAVHWGCIDPSSMNKKTTVPRQNSRDCPRHNHAKHTTSHSLSMQESSTRVNKRPDPPV